MSNGNPPSRASLSPRQSEVMDVIWEYGPSTAEQVRERMPGPLKDSTVRTFLRRLVKKGFLTQSAVGRTYVYEPAVESRHAAARAVQHIVDRFCSGSLEELLVGMVDDAIVSENELKSIADKIAAAKRERKRDGS